MCEKGQPYGKKGGHGYLEIALDSTLHAEDTGSSLVHVEDVSPLPTGEELTRTLVYPAQMTDSSSLLSVLAPVGAALLGLRTGDTIHWDLPGGASAHLEVLELLDQPEAAGDYLL